MEVIIGKEGQQPFQIKNECVSRQHAKISVDDAGHWMLEDLGSTNGTYIQDAIGHFVRIGRVEIDEYTRIALGSVTATGYYFYAHHIMEDEGSYEAEMRHVIRLNEKIMSQKEQLEARNSRTAMLTRFVPCMVTVAVTAVGMLVWPDYMRLFMVLGTSVTGVLGTAAAVFQQGSSSRLKKLYERQTRLVRCPKCNRPLSALEIQSEQCAVCKTHS